MNKQDFLHIVSKPESLDSGQIIALEELSKRFPFCQIAHIIQAMAAQANGSMLSNQKLRTAAVYVSDRSFLKKLISENKFAHPKLSMILDNSFVEQLPANPFGDNQLVLQFEQAPVLEADTLVNAAFADDNLVDDNLASLSAADLQPEARAFDTLIFEKNNEIITEKTADIAQPILETEPVVEPELPHLAEPALPLSLIMRTPTPTAESKNINQEIEENIRKLQINKAMFHEKIETMEQQSFFSLLGLQTLINPEGEDSNNGFENYNQNNSSGNTDFSVDFSLHSDKEPTKTQSNIDHQIQIISRFIDKKRDFLEKKPLSQNVDELVANEDLAVACLTQTHTLVSQTLASLFEKQGKKQKAIEMYEKLCLKYPEKNVYFASQISRLQSGG